MSEKARRLASPPTFTDERGQVGVRLRAGWRAEVDELARHGRAARRLVQRRVGLDRRVVRRARQQRLEVEQDRLLLPPAVVVVRVRAALDQHRLLQLRVVFVPGHHRRLERLPERVVVRVEVQQRAHLRLRVEGRLVGEDRERRRPVPCC